MNRAHWKEVALKLMDILAEYPASKSFWYSEKREKKEYDNKETYPINMTKIKKKLEFDLELEKSGLKGTEDNPEKYPELDQFLGDLLTVFRNTQLFIEPTKSKYKYSQACQTFVMHMLQSENIFSTEKEPEENKRNTNNKLAPSPVVEIQEIEEEDEEEEELDLEERERLMNERLESDDEGDYNISNDGSSKE